MSEPPSAPSADAVVQQIFPSRIAFRYNEEVNELLAQLIRTEHHPRETLFSVKQTLQQAGFQDYLIFDGELQSIVVKAAQGEVGEFVIGERRDADITVSIATSKLGAYVDTRPAYGGEKLSRAWVLKVLKDKGLVDECIDQSAIDQVLTTDSVSNLRIAKAIPPKRGDDAEFEPLVEGLKTLSPTQLETGDVDYRQQMEFIVVEPGTPLMRRKPATRGVDGIDVLGGAILAEAGNDPGFTDAADGAVVDAGDPNLLLAEIKGHPILLPQGIKVDPTLTLDSVNIHSGNVDFDGSVNIRGDVESGYSVTATGDITVKGVVNKGALRAQGNINIAGGVIGDEKGVQNNQPVAASVHAGGNVSARYVNAAEIKAGQRVMVREYLLQSRVMAKDEVCVGQEGGRGTIIGGVTHSQTAVMANELGSDAYIITQIDVGRADSLTPKLLKLEQNKRAKRDERTKLDALLQRIKETLNTGSRTTPKDAITPEKVQKLANTIKAIDAALELYDTEIAKLKQTMAEQPVSRIYVRKKVYPNVAVRIDGVVSMEKAGRGGVTWVRDGDEIVVSDDGV